MWLIGNLRSKNSRNYQRYIVRRTALENRLDEIVRRIVERSALELGYELFVANHARQAVAREYEKVSSPCIPFDDVDFEGLAPRRPPG